MINIFKRSPEHNRLALLFTLTYVVISLIFVFTSIETWDDDCPTRYYYTLNAFNDPKQFISLWNRPLFVLLFAIPAQFGANVVAVCVVLISAISAYFLYKALVEKGTQRAFMIIPLLLFQVYFFGVSRNMESEMLAVALFNFGYFFMVRKKWALFALMGGLLPLARLELVLLLPFWGIILLKEKQWKSILVMMLPFFLWSLGGLIIEGDFFYVLKNTFGKDNSSNRYGHTTFLHYFRRYIYVIGPIAFFFLVIGYIRGIYEKARFRWSVTLQFSAGFFVYVLFSWKLNMGNSAGFMRHLTPLTTLAAILILTGFNYWVDVISSRRRLRIGEKEDTSEEFKVLSPDQIHELSRKQQKQYRKELRVFEKEQSTIQEELDKSRKSWKWKWIFLILVSVTLLLVAYKYWRLEMVSHHMLKLNTEDNWIFYTLGTLTVLTLILPWVLKWNEKRGIILSIIVGVACLSYTTYREAPYKNKSEERKMMEQLVKEFDAFDNEKSDIYANHIWFYWAGKRNMHDDRHHEVTVENLSHAKKGDFCIWESHYSHRLVGDVQANYFIENKNWAPVAVYRSSETAFYCIIYQKVGAEPNLEKSKEAISKFRKKLDGSVSSLMASIEFYTNQSPNKDSVGFYYKLALKEDPDNVTLRFNRGIAYFQQKEFAAAEKDFQICLREKPEWDAALVNLGIARLQLKRPKSAVRLFDKALKRSPKIKNARFNRGNAMMQLKDTTEALSDYSIEINNFPKEPHAYLQRGQIHYRQKNWKQCIDDLNKHLTLSKKGNGNVYMMMGVSFLSLNDKQKARQCFEAAKKMNHPNAGIFIQKYCQ